MINQGPPAQSKGIAIAADLGGNGSDATRLHELEKLASVARPSYDIPDHEQYFLPTFLSWLAEETLAGIWDTFP